MVPFAGSSCVVCINTVGPFRLFGEPVVKACCEAGTHYLDICGEPGKLALGLCWQPWPVWREAGV